MAKKNTIKKSTKTKKSKFSLKKLDFKKNWKKLSYLGLAGFLAVTSLGYGGWKYFDANRASAFKPLATINGVQFSGCKFKQTQFAQTQVASRLQLYNTRNTQAIYSRTYLDATKKTIPAYGVRVTNEWATAYSEFGSTQTLTTSYKVERGNLSITNNVSYSFGSLPWC